MARLALLPLLLLLSSCSTLASKEMTYGCQAADAGTTLYAVHHGAIESAFRLSGLALLTKER